MALCDSFLWIGVSSAKVRAVVKLLRLWFAASMLLACAVASALVQPAVQYRPVSPSNSPWFSAVDAACAHSKTWFESQWATSNAPTSTLTYCRVDGMRLTRSNGTIYDVGIQKSAAQCPTNSVAVSGGCQCASGFDESGGQCVPHVNQCTAQTGQSSMINWTEGYTRTPDEGDTQAVGGVNLPPSTVCSAGCNVSVQKVGPGVEYYVSQQPTSQGLYRRSRDMPGVNLGTECTAGPTDANQPTAPEPQCPGQLGTVGNRVVCLSTAEKPVTPSPLPPPDKTPIAGNPSAGPKPPSGEGAGEGSAGRTPSAGTGGNSGGGAGAAMGGKGGGAGGTAAGAGTGSGAGAGTGNSSGRVTNPGDGTEQANCGAPGQAVCAVKVDESGVPLTGDFSDATSKLGEHQNKVSEALGQVEGMQAPQWSFSFQLPTGCTAYTPAAFEEFGVSINPCNWQGTIHDLMSMIWAAVTAFCIIGMVGRTIREA